MAGEIINLDQAARLFDKSVNTVKAWLKRGLPATRAEGGAKQWRIDTAELLAWCEEQAFRKGQKSVGAAPVPAAPSSSHEADLAALPDKDEADRRRAWAQAKTAELEYELKSGQVAVIADIVKPFLEGMSAHRARLLAVPAKLAPILAAESNVVVVRNAIEAALTLRSIHLGLAGSCSRDPSS